MKIIKLLFVLVVVSALTFSCKSEKKDASEAVDDAVEAVSDAADDTGDAVEDAAEATDEAVEEAAEDVEDAAEEAGEAVEDREVLRAVADAIGRAQRDLQHADQDAGGQQGPDPERRVPLQGRDQHHQPRSQPHPGQPGALMHQICVALAHDGSMPPHSALFMAEPGNGRENAVSRSACARSSRPDRG